MEDHQVAGHTADRRMWIIRMVVGRTAVLLVARMAVPMTTMTMVHTVLVRMAIRMPITITMAHLRADTRMPGVATVTSPPPVPSSIPT
jgi:hypothetical protein